MVDTTFQHFFPLCSFPPFLPSFMIFLFIFRNGSFSLPFLWRFILCINHISVFSTRTRLLNPSSGRENEFVSVRRKCLWFRYLDQASLPVFLNLLDVISGCSPYNLLCSSDETPPLDPMCEFSEELLTLNISLYLLRIFKITVFSKIRPCLALINPFLGNKNTGIKLVPPLDEKCCTFLDVVHGITVRDNEISIGQFVFVGSSL